MTTVENKKKSVIYEPSGQAAEYCRRAMNLHDGCIIGCRYCYAPLVCHKDRKTFHRQAAARLTVGDIQACAAASKDDKRPVLMCFTSDPYQPLPLPATHLVRSAMIALHQFDQHFTILTKAGDMAQRDFDLYRPGDSFGVTLTFMDRMKSAIWEPMASPPEERIKNLQAAKMAGIDTWVSLEPVIDPAQSLAIIEATAGFVDHYKTGPLNYYKGDLPVPEYDRKGYVQKFIDLAAIKYKRGINVKSAFSAAFGSPDGYKIGEQLP